MTNINEKLRKDKQNADATKMFLQVSLMYKEGSALINDIYLKYKGDLDKETKNKIKEYLQRTDVINESLSKTASVYGN